MIVAACATVRGVASRPSARGASGVETDQAKVHPALGRVIRQRQGSCYGRPVATRAYETFRQLDDAVRIHAGPVIMDSGCGTGESTWRLARQFPNALAIGIDKSAHRLRHGEALLSARPLHNVRLARANCVDLWRLARRARWPVMCHFLLYPNPWPKRKHLKRRWHAHPVMADLLALGGRLELRSNWRIYIEEFGTAVHLLTGVTANISHVEADEPISPFERKYGARGHPLYRLLIDLPGGGRTTSEPLRKDGHGHIRTAALRGFPVPMAHDST